MQARAVGERTALGMEEENLRGALSVSSRGKSMSKQAWRL